MGMWQSWNLVMDLGEMLFLHVSFRGWETKGSISITNNITQLMLLWFDIFKLYRMKLEWGGLLDVNGLDQIGCDGAEGVKCDSNSIHSYFF